MPDPSGQRPCPWEAGMGLTRAGLHARVFDPLAGGSGLGAWRPADRGSQQAPTDLTRDAADPRRPHKAAFPQTRPAAREDGPSPGPAPQTNTPESTGCARTRLRGRRLGSSAACCRRGNRNAGSRVDGVMSELGQAAAGTWPAPGAPPPPHPRPHFRPHRTRSRPHVPCTNLHRAP